MQAYAVNSRRFNHDEESAVVNTDTDIPHSPKEFCCCDSNPADDDPSHNEHPVYLICKEIKQDTVDHLAKRLGAQGNRIHIGHNLAGQVFRCSLLDKRDCIY